MDFEEMRNQFAILKQQLQHQEIVSDRLLRETVKTKKNAINSAKRLVYGAVIFCLLVMPLNYFAHSWSLPFTIGTILLLLLSAVVTHYIHQPVDELNLMKDDLSTVAHVMAKFKKQYNQQLYYWSPVILVPWIIWACYDFISMHAIEAVHPWLLVIPILIGGAIGLGIGLYFHFKAVNAAQDIIDQIED